jgi:hypothetical protein
VRGGLYTTDHYDYVPLSEIGRLLKGGGNRRYPRTIDICISNEHDIPFPVLEKTIKGIKKGETSLLNEVRGEYANAVVFLHIQTHDPLFWWCVIRACLN